MHQLQFSLTTMFAITAAAALAVIVFRNVSVYWIVLFCAAVVLFRIPAWEGVNPVLWGTGSMLVMLVISCGLSYAMKVPAFQTIFPCFILPAIAYIVGFIKGMENA